MKTVQTKDQYVFLHQVVLDALGHCERHRDSLTGKEHSVDQTSQDLKEYQNLIIGEGNISVHNTRPISEKYQNLIIGQESLPGQRNNNETYQSIIPGDDKSLEHLYDDLQCTIKGQAKSASGQLPDDIGLNKTSSIVPAIESDDEDTGSMKAVYLASVTDHKAFITLQMPDTAKDFWRLVYEQNVSSIVMLNDVKSEGVYWPMSDKQVQFSSYSITLTETTPKSFGKVSMLLLRANQEDRVVKQYRCTVWPDSSMIPTSALPILELISTVQSGVDKGPVIVHCMDGATKCGVYCTIAAAMQEMETAHKTDIPQIIQRYRQVRPKMIRNLEQFRFCYDVMKEYCSIFDSKQDS